MCTFAPKNRTAGTDSMKKCVFHIGFLVILMLCSSCVSRGVREAQEVVAQADSLWHDGQMYGIDAGDSATLAQAYETLDKSTAFCRRVREIFPFAHSTSSLGTYSHACYHYGRLLREKDDPVAAMQAFINATHSHTDDYHILGRVYSNMGSICHLAGEFPLSYDMYERCADMYLQNGDTLLYYYGLNDMAFELAEQGKKDSCFLLINDIVTNNPNDSILIAYSHMSQAQACLFNAQYDSTIYYAQLSKDYFPFIISTTIQLAQGYSYIGLKDSATFYAKQVLLKSNALSEINNALYILTNDDKTKDLKEVRQAAADRSDVQKMLETRQGKMSQAVQLLEQDLTSKPNLAWLYAISITIIIIGLIIWLYVWRKRRQHALLSQQVEELNHINSAAKRQHEQIKNEYRILNQNKISKIEQNCIIISQAENFPKNINWKNYDSMCGVIDQHFFFLTSKLKQKKILNEQDIRLCVLVLLNLNRNQIASVLPYSQTGIGKLKYRVARKLETDGKNLRKFLICMAIDESKVSYD